jgi:hypothetical protein
MAKLSSKERQRRVRIARKLIQSKARSKPYGKAFRKLNRIFLKDAKFHENGYEFAKASPKIDAKKLRKNKALIRKIYPNAKFSAKIRGYYVPRQLAGPSPRLKFTDSSFSVGGKGLPSTEFHPVEPEIFTGDNETDMQRIDRILKPFNNRDILEAVAENGADLSQYGYAKRKPEMRKLILDWIATYGWTQSPTKDPEKNHDMANWFAGIRVYKERDDADEET